MGPTSTSAAPDACLRTDSGRILSLSGDRWVGRAQAADLTMLSRVEPPVLDIGCGPGRHIEALAELGTFALGIDLSSSAVDVCRQKGLNVLERSVFDAIPQAGQWGGALLLDGNIGIGGDPVRLLRRVKALLRPDGKLVVEVEQHSVTPVKVRVRLELGDSPGPWFDWVDLDIAGLRRAAAAADLTVIDVLDLDERLFGVLRNPPAPC